MSRRAPSGVVNTTWPRSIVLTVYRPSRSPSRTIRGLDDPSCAVAKLKPLAETAVPNTAGCSVACCTIDDDDASPGIRKGSSGAARSGAKRSLATAASISTAAGVGNDVSAMAPVDRIAAAGTAGSWSAPIRLQAPKASASANAASATRIGGNRRYSETLMARPARRRWREDSRCSPRWSARSSRRARTRRSSP